jgi:hypothetical protein
MPLYMEPIDITLFEKCENTVVSVGKKNMFCISPFALIKDNLRT